jgi:hypothetical protein
MASAPRMRKVEVVVVMVFAVATNHVTLFGLESDPNHLIINRLETMSNPGFGTPIVIPPQFQIYKCVCRYLRDFIRGEPRK